MFGINEIETKLPAALIENSNPKRIDGVTGGAAAMVPTGCACRKSGLSLSEGSREGAESDRNRFYIALGRSGKPNRMR
jgi:hypothetical protein